MDLLAAIADESPHSVMIHPEIDILVDKLTNSIENRVTGQVVKTEVRTSCPEDLSALATSDWLFDWQAEHLDPRKIVYKLCVINQPDVIEGLISLEIKADHVFVHLAENAPSNRGGNKIHLGVAGNLFAFACHCAFLNGLDGFVAFDAKTALIDHYSETLGASRLSGQRMYIGTSAAIQLVQRYLKDQIP
jgi:hypothetical protein